MFGFGKKKLRQLDNVDQLKEGDIVSFKDRPPLPISLQGKDFEVIQVAGYQYNSDNQNDFTLKSADDQIISLCVEQEDGEVYLCISRKIPQNQVLSLFNEDDFSMLWGEDYPQLEVQQVPNDLQDWVDRVYEQKMKDGTAFYYKRDLREQPPSQYEDDDSMEMRYHECEGQSGDFGLTVEIYEDGETDVSLVAYVPLDVIDDLHPAEADDE